MSNKYDPILGAYRQADTVDLSGYIPYTGATTNVDLGYNTFATTGLTTLGTLLVNELSPYDNSVAFEVNGKGGFNDGSVSAYFCSSYAIEATGNCYFNGVVGIGTTPLSTMLGVNYGNVYARICDGSYIAGVFEDGTNITNLATGTYAISTTGNCYFAGSSGADTLFLQAGSSGNALTFADNTVQFSGTLGASTYAGHFYDQTNVMTVDLCDGTNAINSTGNVKMQGLLTGAGAPATILTNFNLYVDTATGLVYVD